MALVDSLLSAIVRADGDALVMHVGERPYVVVGTQTINISTHGMNLDAMTGMLGQLLPADSMGQLEEFGAVEYRVPHEGDDRFTVVAARGGDDIWIEIRRRRPQPAVAVEPPKAPEVVTPPAPPVAVAAPLPVVAAPMPAPEPVAEPIAAQAQAAPGPVAAQPAEPELVVVNAQLEPIVSAAVEQPAAPKYMIDSLLAEPAPVLEVISMDEPAIEPEPEAAPFEVPEPVYVMEAPTEAEFQTAHIEVIETEPQIAAEAAPLTPVVELAPQVLPASVAETLAQPLWATESSDSTRATEGSDSSRASEGTGGSDRLEQVEVAAPIVERIPEPVAAVAAPIVESASAREESGELRRDRAEAAFGREGGPIPEPVAAIAPPIVESASAREESGELRRDRAEAAFGREGGPIPEPVAVVAPPIVESASAREESGELRRDRAEAAFGREGGPIPEPVAVVAPPIVESASAREESGELRRDRAEAAFGREGGPIPEPVAAVATPMPEPTPMPIAASVETAPPEPEREMTSGVVLPMTRTLRIEAPPRVPARTSADIERLLRVAVARGASALFLTSDSRPFIRVEGDLRQLESESALSRADVERAIMDMAPESGHESIGKGEATEWLSEFADIGRIRCTTFNDHRGPGVLLRMIATRAATAEQLGLAREVQALATEPQGIVLIAGPRSSGKSTLLSALVDLVNRQRAEFVITLERQIRLVHDNKNALVSQREIRGGAEDSVAAARSALRENPDVLVVDDLVSPHMVPLLLTAASDGLLVFVSITAPSTADAVQRFIELAPPEMRKAVLTAMAESFRGAVAQTLLKKAGGGLVAAREVLLATAPVTRVIADGQLGQLPLALESGRKHGMVSFTEALAEYVRSGTVDVREAFRKAPDRDRLLQQLKRDGVDTSVVERLA